MITNGVPDSIIPKSNTINLLKSVPGGLFQHYNKLFTQIDGVSMGNPLAPTIADYSTGTSRKHLFETEDENNPVVCLRYTDEIFCIFRKDGFLKNKLNKLHK